MLPPSPAQTWKSLQKTSWICPPAPSTRPADLRSRRWHQVAPLRPPIQTPQHRQQLGELLPGVSVHLGPLLRHHAPKHFLLAPAELFYSYIRAECIWKYSVHLNPQCTAISVPCANKV
jgi:hypothetical protein